MLTVAADPDLVERLLRDGELRCPRCGTGVLGGHGRVPGRWLRQADGLVVLLKAHATAEEIASGTVAAGLRRGMCSSPGARQRMCSRRRRCCGGGWMRPPLSARSWRPARRGWGTGGSQAGWAGQRPARWGRQQGVGSYEKDGRTNARGAMQL